MCYQIPDGVPVEQTLCFLRQAMAQLEQQKKYSEKQIPNPSPALVPFENEHTSEQKYSPHPSFNQTGQTNSLQPTDGCEIYSTASLVSNNASQQIQNLSVTVSKFLH